MITNFSEKICKKLEFAENLDLDTDPILSSVSDPFESNYSDPICDLI